jgi:dihydroxy-acid dehydratase
VARAAEVEFSMKDIDELSRRIPNLCKVAPSSTYHVEDVNRAGGVMAIMGELDRAGLIDTSVKRVDAPTLAQTLDAFDIVRKTAVPEAIENARSAPAGGRNLVLGSQSTLYAEPDTDRANGCVRDTAHAYGREGGLAVLFGNIAPSGCIVKTAGVDPSIYKFRGAARVYDSQEAACEGILSGKLQAGEVVVIRYEGPKGGPGMQEMLYPTSYLKSVHLDKQCALLTDGRFSGGTAGLSIGHVSPEAASGGAIALIEDGDLIEINIPKRKIILRVPRSELSARRKKQKAKGPDAFRPAGRNRNISESLRAYALHAASADKGAVREID